MLYTCDIILHVLQSNVVSLDSLDSLAAVLVSSRNAPPRGALRDDTKNGCEGD